MMGIFFKNKKTNKQGNISITNGENNAELIYRIANDVSNIRRSSESNGEHLLKLSTKLNKVEEKLSNMDSRINTLEIKDKEKEG